MQRFLNALTHKRTMTVIGLIVIAAILFAGALWFEIDLEWPAIILGAVLALVVIV